MTTIPRVSDAASVTAASRTIRKRVWRRVGNRNAEQGKHGSEAQEEHDYYNIKREVKKRARAHDGSYSASMSLISSGAHLFVLKHRDAILFRARLWKGSWAELIFRV